MAKQGKCTQCNTHWVWGREKLLHEVTCPNCGDGLKRTSHTSHWNKRALQERQLPGQDKPQVGKP